MRDLRTDEERAQAGDGTPSLGIVHLNCGDKPHRWCWHCSICGWLSDLGNLDTDSRVCPECRGGTQELRARLDAMAAAGQGIRDARRAAGLTLRQCATQAGCNLTELSAMEMGRTPPSEAMRRLLGLETVDAARSAAGEGTHG